MSAGSLLGDVLWSIAVLYAVPFVGLGLKKKPSSLDNDPISSKELRERENQVYGSAYVMCRLEFLQLRECDHGSVTHRHMLPACGSALPADNAMSQQRGGCGISEICLEIRELMLLF